MGNRRIAAGFMAVIMASMVLAQAVASQPLVFRRDMLTIIPLNPVAVMEETDDKDEPGEVPVAQPFQLATEIRSQQSLKLNWIHSLTGLAENYSVLILFEAPDYYPLMPANFYEPLDVIAVDAQGVMTQLVPSIALVDLTQPIVPNDPIRARLYLAAGTIKRYGLTPGARIEHPLFRAAPEVISR